jgi:hypothetical protein
MLSQMRDGCDTSTAINTTATTGPVPVSYAACTASSSNCTSQDNTSATLTPEGRERLTEATRRGHARIGVR